MLGLVIVIVVFGFWRLCIVSFRDSYICWRRNHEVRLGFSCHLAMITPFSKDQSEISRSFIITNAIMCASRLKR